jgi:hypothetical protein
MPEPRRLTPDELAKLRPDVLRAELRHATSKLFYWERQQREAQQHWSRWFDYVEQIKQLTKET